MVMKTIVKMVMTATMVETVVKVSDGIIRY